MTVEFFNLYYFIYIFIAIISTILLYNAFKEKSHKTKSIVVFTLLLINFALHFLKVLFPPYSLDPMYALKNVWAINICAVSVLVFPFIFISKNKMWKDFMFYLGVISGFLALIIPTEALGESPILFDTIRFYIAHAIIIIAPLLMVLFKVHTINYKRIWKMPFCMMTYMLFIICNQVLQSELGIVGLRGNDILAIGYSNHSLIWGPGDDVFGRFFTIFTPDFMKTIPVGAVEGAEKYWPFFWIIPGITVYFLVLPFLIILPSQKKEIKQDLQNLFYKIKNRFKPKQVL